MALFRRKKKSDAISKNALIPKPEITEERYRDLGLADQSTSEARIERELYKELVNTEIDYINDLKTLLAKKNDFLKGRSKKSEKLLNGIFQKVEKLVEQHQILLFALQNNEPATWLSNIEGLKSAHLDFQNYQEKLNSAPHLKDLMVKENFNLNSYLIKPTQRAVKYPLLLKDFTKDKFKDKFSAPFKHSGELVGALQEEKVKKGNAEVIKKLKTTTKITDFDVLIPSLLKLPKHELVTALSRLTTKSKLSKDDKLVAAQLDKLVELYRTNHRTYLNTSNKNTQKDLKEEKFKLEIIGRFVAQLKGPQGIAEWQKRSELATRRNDEKFTQTIKSPAKKMTNGDGSKTLAPPSKSSHLAAEKHKGVIFSPPPNLPPFNSTKNGGTNPSKRTLGSKQKGP